MARAPTTTDAFTAIAEPRRRDILGALAGGGDKDVTWLVEELGWPQPQVSKHLGVLRQVGLSTAPRESPQRCSNETQLSPSAAAGCWKVRSRRP